MDEITRRHFIKLGASALAGSMAAPALASGQSVNDLHSGLNPTRVSEIVRPQSKAQLIKLVQNAIKTGRSFSICGARHAGGGQQFLENHLLLDCTAFNQVLNLDTQKGLLTVDPGARWQDLLTWLHGDYLQEVNRDPGPWTIRQRPTGTDSLTIGGTVSCNAHGQGLNFKPLIDDIESFSIIAADGKEISVSRSGEHHDLFPLVIGGYGLFGLLTSVTLRLVPTAKYQCQAQPITINDIPAWHAEAIASGCQYGSVQICIDESSNDFLLAGVANKFVEKPRELPSSTRPPLSSKDWTTLVTTAHTDKSAAWRQFSNSQLTANKAVDWGFRWHSSPYFAGYHRAVDKQLKTAAETSEVLTEVYVPMDSLPQFMTLVAADCRANATNIVYSTVRFIAQDRESFLPWAKGSFACVIFNLHTGHRAKEIESVAKALRLIISRAEQLQGSYYLTYHRFAEKSQVLSCYPQFPRMLAEKLKRDPHEVFQSDWYRHYKKMFSSELSQINQS